MSAPKVSVLMPTFRHAPFIRRALGSLRRQTFQDWELVIVDDGSPDETQQVLDAYRSDARLRIERLERNHGLGAALNIATRLARGEYLAYLPSDDVYDPEHLERLVAVLEREPRVYLAYGGVRWSVLMHPEFGMGAFDSEDLDLAGPTLQGKAAVGREREVLRRLRDKPGVFERSPLRDKNAQRPEPNNLLALVQVMHRRRLEREVRWPTREESESDRLEPDFWDALLSRRARFRYAGQITCEWVFHAEQRHQLILNPRQGGRSRFRQHYGLGAGEWLNWKPSNGPWVDERAWYGGLARRRESRPARGLKILLAGELGANPERILALEEDGHRLAGLWIPRPGPQTNTGPFPYGNVEHIPYAGGWQERVRAFAPDVVYALLNWQSIPLIAELVDAGIGAPLVFHFKHDPFVPRQQGTWPDLVRILDASDGLIFHSEEARGWFQLATDGRIERKPVLVHPGDLPKADWLRGRWSPKRSRKDGALHLVCMERPPLREEWLAPVLAAGKMHLHVYGAEPGLRASRRVHLHDLLPPARWVRELSQYDAAWLPTYLSENQGDLRRATAKDLEVPPEVWTYAFAGLPWILADNARAKVTVDRLAREHELGIFYVEFEHLIAQLHDERQMGRLGRNARRARQSFSFEHHAGALVSFLRQVRERRAA